MLSRFAAAAAALSLVAGVAHAQVSCQRLGTMVSCSNGQTFTTMGNTTSDNQGNSWILHGPHDVWIGRVILPAARRHDIRQSRQLLDPNGHYDLWL